VLRDGVTLELAENAVLRAIPVASRSYSVVRAVGARNVRIRGGSILGERAAHLGTDGEWGMGILIRGCDNVLIENVRTAECWGDGICVVPMTAGTGTECRNVVIRNCRSHNNRRQGLSITGCIGVVVEHCEFSDTAGTAPQSGIDLEPDTEYDRVRDVRIAHCTFLRNAGYGIALVGRNVTDVVLEQNRCAENKHEGIFLREARRVTATGNVVELNGANGVWLGLRVQEAEFRSNVIRSNSTAAPMTFDNVWIDQGSSGNLVADNDFSPVSPEATVPRFDICIVSGDCVGNRLHRNRVREMVSGTGGIADNGTATEVVASEVAG
jgi:hypothetical protein